MTRTGALGLALGLAFAVGAPAVAQAPAGAPAAAAPPVPENYRPPKKRISAFASYADAMMKTPAAQKPTPRTPDGKPDLSGMWGNIPSIAGFGGLRKDGTFEPDQAALQRSSGWDKPIYKPEYWNKVRSLDFGEVTDDPVYNCGTPGTPRQNAPAKIVQTPHELIFIYGGLRTRIIPIGRKLTAEDMDMSTFDGVSAGHWDGDTLVVESVGFNDISWIQWQGYFHTNQMKVTERLWRRGDLLFYNFTVDDPDVLMEPWTQGTLVRRQTASGDALAAMAMGEADPCEVIPAGGDLHLRG